MLTYIGNGLFQIFVGILTLGATDVYTLLAKKLNQDTGITAETVDTARVYTGYIMAGTGVAYLLLVSSYLLSLLFV